MFWLITASLIWAFSFGLIKTRLSGLPPDSVALARMSFAFLTCFALSVIQRCLCKKSGSIAVPNNTRAAWKFRAHLMLVGIFQMGMMYNVYLRSFQYLAAYQVALFTSITPVWVWFLARAYEFRESRVWKLSWKECAIALSAVIAGAYVAWLQKSVGSSAHGAASGIIEVPFGLSAVVYGFILVQIANFCFSLGQIHYVWVLSTAAKAAHVSEASGKISSPGTVLGTSLVTMNFVFLGAMLWLSPALRLSAHVSHEQWIVLLYLGSVATGIGFYIWNQGAIRVGKLTLAVMNNLKAPLAVTVSMLVFGEKADAIGIVSSLAMLAIAQWAAGKLDRK